MPTQLSAVYTPGTMKRSAPTDALPATKRTRRRTKSTPEKRQSTSQRKQRERSNSAGTAQADIARENDRLRMQRSRASKENTPPPSQQESTPSREDGHTYDAVDKKIDIQRKKIALQLDAVYRGEAETPCIHLYTLILVLAVALSMSMGMG
jgi:hypothetical protein